MDGNVRIEELEQHLLFHKALADDEESLRRLGGYMDILSRAESGERLQDPVDESIRAVFSLVLENGMDPWASAVCDEIYKETGVMAAVVDANDYVRDILGKCSMISYSYDEIAEMIKDNPSGQSTQMTPFVIIRKVEN